MSEDPAPPQGIPWRNSKHPLLAQTATQEAFLKRLKDEGINLRNVLNYADEEGNTSLHYAIKDRDLPFIDGLIFNGADINKANNIGITPLHLASDANSLDIVRYLCEHGADVSIRGQDGSTVLMLACINNNTDMIKYFIGPMDLSVNDKNDAGITPLMLACATGNIENVDLLLSRGADVKAVALDGTTALTSAKEGDNKEIVGRIQSLLVAQKGARRTRRAKKRNTSARRRVRK